MRRQCPLNRRSPMRSRAKRLTAREHHTYKLATERARTIEGYLRCEGCDRSLLDGQEERHHIVPRSRGGTTNVCNLAVLCLTCHRQKHGDKPPDQRALLTVAWGEEAWRSP
jgi:5-methylcytosine-specific restriction endonuclease McrA